MDKDKVARISATLGNISGIFAERVRQDLPSHGGKVNAEWFHAQLLREGEKLRLEDLPELADGFLALRSAIGEMDNA
jgi:hypothetical protein